MKKATVWLLFCYFLTGLLFFILHLFKWEFLYFHLLVAALAAAATMFFTIKRIGVFIREFKENKGLERWRQCSGTAVIALAILILGISLSTSFVDINVVVDGFYRSPNSKHELVVLHTPFVYIAQPSLFRLFYNTNSFDCVGHIRKFKDIQVQWQNDGSARVYFINDPAKGPVEEDSILVSFDSATS